MTKTVEKHVKVGVPYRLKINSLGKWQISDNLTFEKDDEREFSYTTEVYDGLKYTTDFTQDIGIIDFAETILPWTSDYSDKLEVSKFALGSYNKTFELGEYKPNMEVIDNGRIAILADDTTDITLESDKKYSAQVVFTTGEDITTKQIIISNSTDGSNGMSIQLENGIFYFCCANFNIKFSLANYTSVTPNTTYTLGVWYEDIPAYRRIGAIINDNSGIYFSNRVLTGTTIKGMFISNDVKGTYDLEAENTYVQLGDNIIWRYDESMETLNGCLYNYTDDGSEITLKTFVVNGDERIVLSNDMITKDDLKYDDYVVNSVDYLGVDVNIPEHPISN